MTMPSRNALPMLLTAALAACAAAPLSYYTLVPAPRAQPAATAAPLLVEVAPISVPVEVDRYELVVRHDDGRLDLLERVRWIAPLADEFQSAFKAGLGRTLDLRDISGLPRAPGTAVTKVKLALRRFESVPGQYAAIAADWSVAWPADGAKPLLCSSRLRTSVGAGYAGLVQGHQQLVAQLADQVAATLRDGSTASCPTPAP